MKYLLAVLLVIGLAGPGVAQTMTFQEAFSGKPIPLTLKMKNLDEAWRRMNISGLMDASNPAMAYRAIFSGQMSGGAFFTKGQTIMIGNEGYLVGYTIQSKPVDMSKMQMLMNRGASSEPEKLTAQTLLGMALVNVRSLSSITDVRPFNLEAELTGAEAAGTEDEKHALEINEASARNLGKLAAAVTAYVNERKVLPLATDVRTAEQELILYVGSKDVFLQPEVKKPYRPNPAVAGRKLSDFDKPERIVAFYEVEPGGDGTRGVLFLDGHIDRLIESQWKKLKETAKLP